jgi:hypothetical protein
MWMIGLYFLIGLFVFLIEFANLGMNPVGTALVWPIVGIRLAFKAIWSMEWPKPNCQGAKPPPTMPRPDVTPSGRKLCRFCKHANKPEALFCSHCGRSFDKIGGVNQKPYGMRPEPPPAPPKPSVQPTIQILTQ